MKLHTIGISLLLSSCPAIYCSQPPAQPQQAKPAPSTYSPQVAGQTGVAVNPTAPMTIDERLGRLEVSIGYALANQHFLSQQIAANQQQLVAGQNQIFQLLTAMSRKQNSMEADAEFKLHKMSKEMRERFNAMHHLNQAILHTLSDTSYDTELYGDEQDQQAYYEHPPMSYTHRGTHHKLPQQKPQYAYCAATAAASTAAPQHTVALQTLPIPATVSKLGAPQVNTAAPDMKDAQK